jgi:hypothetical protein
MNGHENLYTSWVQHNNKQQWWKQRDCKSEPSTTS